MIDKGEFRSIRLQSHDYSEAGHYFVTINIHKRSHHFGHIRAGKMMLSRIGDIAQDYWCKLPERFPSVRIDEYVIMPDHMHGIITISDDAYGQIPSSMTDEPDHPGHPDHPDHPVTAIHELRLPGETETGETELADPDIGGIDPDPSIYSSTAQSFDHEQYRRDRRQMLLPKVIGWYKMNVAREANLLLNHTGTPFWQRNYYEHIIRTERALFNIRRYIRDNPRNWKK